MTNSKLLRNSYFTSLVVIAIMVLIGLYCCATFGPDQISVSYIRDIAVDTLGMLVGEVLIIGLIAEDRTDRHNQTMFGLIYGLIILFFLDVITSCIEYNPKYVTGVIAVNTLIFIMEDLVAISFWGYIRGELNLDSRGWKIADKVCLIALGIVIVVELFNCKFGFMFTVSDAGEYIGEPFEFVGDLAIVVVLIVTVIAIIQSKDKTVREKRILFTFISFPMTAYVLGSIRQEYIWIQPAYLLSALLIYIRIFSERSRKLAEQQVQLTKQSTALMISQIQPHFLYNVLTTISNLCVTDPEEAEETTVLFSQYLRTNLDSLRNDEPVPFATEMGHIRTYVELEKKRFGDILNVEYDIKEQGFKVPSLGLQPIVENSIKHGIRGKNAPGHIKISTCKVDGGYRVIIEDDGIGFDMNAPHKEDGRSHVGMNNVRERLRQMVNATMTVESSPGNGCRTDIFIPE